MKRTLLALFLVFAVALTFAGTAKADTIMFPYINSNPGNVSTVISIVNGTAALGSPTTGVGALHYRYITKQITSDADADLTSACSEQNFCRPTSPNDIVSFDTAGQLPDGRAMFGDPGAGFSTNPPFSQITYNSGGGNPPFFNDPNIPMPRRGYLLVTHATNPTSCVDICVQGELDGDAVLIDIVNAAAWGYKAVLNSTTGCAG
ncbi:MAG TPA: hypothetical protein VN328_02300, partial [Thermodesulfovibrionales bacterium]|nr:hypothetical protein [Thermodesulfovibrionales bacterium]